MEGFEQEREKPDLHILEQPLVCDRPLLLSSWLWGTCFWGLTKSLKEQDPTGHSWAGVNTGCVREKNERERPVRVGGIQTKPSFDVRQKVRRQKESHK